MTLRDRILTAVLRYALALGWARWVVVLILLLLASMAYSTGGWPLVLALVGLALVQAVIILVAEGYDYTLFMPDPSAAATSEALPPSFASGVATGIFWTWDRFKWLAPDRQCHVYVQVRWLAEERPPVLAVTRPTDLPPDIKNPLEEADELSLWTPGVEVTPGWMQVKGHLYPALRMRYFGKRLTLALEREEQVGAIVAALRE